MTAVGATQVRDAVLYAVDIGSTVIKFACVNAGGDLIHQEFHQRNFELEIIEQLDSILAPYRDRLNRLNLVICSSANGGLRVGIICLSESFSGATIRSQVLLGGANPVFVQEIRNATPHTGYVDMLLVGGGIDCQDVGPMRSLVECFEPALYHYGSLVFVGNSFLANEFRSRFPDAKSIGNPIAEGLTTIRDTVFEAVRDAYLDDLVYKRGISEISERIDAAIRPTPEVVNRGYYKAITEHSLPGISGASILIDIGGATTDCHYTVEIIRDDSPIRSPTGSSVARYVFTDLGVIASRDSVMLQLRRNPRTFEFLNAFLEDDVGEIYRLLREGECSPTSALLAGACLFLSLDRFSQGNGPGLPTADFGKLDKLVLTGGAAQLIENRRAADIASLFVPSPVDTGLIMVDRHYEIWVRGALAHFQDGESDDRRQRQSAES